MSTQMVKIQGEIYEIPAPYAEGHQLTAAEAAVLNQTFAENVRNNVASRIRKAAEDGTPGLSAEDVEAYASTYTFESKGTRSSGGGRTAADPVEREARALAKTAIMAHLKAKGKKLNALFPEKEARAEWLNARIDQLLEADESFRVSAKELVASRAAAVSNASASVEI